MGNYRFGSPAIAQTGKHPQTFPTAWTLTGALGFLLWVMWWFDE